MRLLGLVSVALALTVATAPPWLTFRNRGISIRYPPSWSATKRQLTPVDWPPQVIAIASYPFPKEPRPNGCMRAGTLAKMPPRGVFIFGIEYTYTPSKDFPTGRIRVSDFPPRPAHFELGSARRYECFGARRSYRVRFRQARRFFLIEVGFGPQAKAGAHSTVLRVLDSLRATRR